MFSLLSYKKNWKITGILIFVFFALIGMLNTSYQLKSYTYQQIYHFSGKQGLLFGTVYQEETEQDNNYQEIRLNTHSFQYQNQHFEANGQVLLRIYGENLVTRPGDRIRVEVLLKEPGLPGNFGEFNYRDYLARQNIFLTGNIESDQVEILGYSKKVNISTLFQDIKFMINQKINQIYPSPAKGLIKAIITGDRKEILPEWTDLFQDAGVMHILAISGLHVGILAMTLFFIFQPVSTGGRKSRFRYLMIILILLGYAAMTGFRPSVSRATLMFTIVLVARCLNRPYHLYNSLYLSALIILLWQPLYLFDAGFLLSFVITFFIIFLSPILEEKLIFLPSCLTKPLSISLSAWLGMAPLSAYFFNQISLIAILSNILIVPLIGIILILALISIFISFLFLPLAGLLALGNQILISSLVLLSKKFSSLSFACHNIARPEIGLIMLYYLVILVFFYTVHFWSEYSLPEKKKRFWTITVFIFALLFFPLIYPASLLAVHFINVGQGDCILIQTPCQKNILIDGGGTPYHDFDVGENTVIPYLRRVGISQVDLIILTHPDLDHLEGLIPVLKEMKVNMVIDSGITVEDETYQTYLSLIKEDDHISYYQAGAGDRIRISPDLEFLVLNPFQPLAYRVDHGFNNHSVVLKLRYKKTDFLFTGDIEESAEINLLTWKEILESDILKVAHHGSNTSTSELFMERVRPVVAVISVGSNNFGHPHQEVMARLEDRCQKVFRTDLNGTVLVKSDGKKYYLSTLR